MRVAIAGGTGFLGSQLVDLLVRRGHDVVVLTRRPESTPPWSFGHGDPARVRVAPWHPDDAHGGWARILEGIDVVCNLAGASIGEGRWTAARKQAFVESRVAATHNLVRAASSMSVPPSVFLNASGVSYYGSRGDEVLTEDSPPGDDFLARLCIDWEEAAREAARFARVVMLRSGIVLDANGGALPRMAQPFRFFAGGRLGTGRQYLSWIHLSDWTKLATWLIENDRISGPVNATAPEPVTNREFTRALAAALNRPAFFPATAFMLRLILGRERAQALLLGSCRAIPARALDGGFRFLYSDVAAALAAVYSGRRR